MPIIKYVCATKYYSPAQVFVVGFRYALTSFLDNRYNAPRLIAIEDSRALDSYGTNSRAAAKSVAKTITCNPMPRNHDQP